ncbi:MAG TPA: PAS domain S-box protein, partial [Chloroflexota bacterium]
MAELAPEAAIRFRAFAESSMEARISADGAGTIIYVNRRAESLFGYAADELVGQPLTMLMPERLREAHRQGIEGFRSGSQHRFIGETVELTARRRDGLEFPIELALASWTSSANEIFFFGNLRDITERKRAEEERQRLLAELRELSSARERLLEDVAHELRGPLTSLGLTIDLYKDLNPDQLDDLMQRAERAVSRLQGLVDDMLDARGIQTGSFHVEARPEPLGELIEAALDAVEPLLEGAGQHVECSLPAAAVVVLADRPHVVCALFNLLSNASKYSASGAAIRLAADVRAKQVRISVIDRGPGIAGEDQARLFERFYRAESGRQRPGVGLGLAIVRG